MINNMYLADEKEQWRLAQRISTTMSALLLDLGLSHLPDLDSRFLRSLRIVLIGRQCVMRADRILLRVLLEPALREKVKEKTRSTAALMLSGTVKEF